MAMVMAIMRITKNVMRCEMLMALSMAILRVGPGGLSAWQPCENSGFGVAGGGAKENPGRAGHGALCLSFETIMHQVRIGTVPKGGLGKGR